MSRRVVIFLLGALVLPASILGTAVAYQSRNAPSDCAGRDPWMRQTTTRFLNAEGAAGAVDRFAYSVTSQAMQEVADSYAAAAAAQKASNPPPPLVSLNALVVTYFQDTSENWTGWIDRPYLNVHNYLEQRALDKQLHAAEAAIEDHCA